MSNAKNADPEPAARAAWMRVLALAQPHALGRACAGLGQLPDHRWLRKPETGMVMVRARSGGNGGRFNLGEMTITRCAVTLDAGTIGVAYVQGRDTAHAERAAVLDALLQLPGWHDRVQAEVIAPLARAYDERLAAQAQRAASTRVEFFTMARGEDQ